MDKQKQIEEMHQILLSAGYDWWETAPNGKTKSEYEAECFYNAGYRKLPENAVGLTREERDSLYTEEEYEKGCKETAEKFAEMAKEALRYVDCTDKEYYAFRGKIDEICKEIVEGNYGKV